MTTTHLRALAAFDSAGCGFTQLARGYLRMYAFNGICQRRGCSMGSHAFHIFLMPEFKKAVKDSEINQDNVDTLIIREGRYWLDSTGFDRKFDPDNCGFNADPMKPPGPNAYYAHEPRTAIRVRWGEWGPEHISVPGNACGLDIDRSSVGNPFDGGSMLCPHNIDSLYQKHLLLIVFTEIAGCVLTLASK